MTDANGYYKVQASLGFGASSGWVNISMTKNGYDTVQKAGWVNDGQLVRWDATIHLKRFKDRTLTGLVRDAATGAPIPGAYVEEGACQYDERVCVWTDRDGRYTKKLTYDERIGPIGKTLWISSPDWHPAEAGDARSRVRRRRSTSTSCASARRRACPAPSSMPTPSRRSSSRRSRAAAPSR